MKKVISIALVIAMLMSLMGGTAYATNADTLVIAAENERVLTGNWVTVTLWVAKNPGFQGISLYPLITDANGKKVNWPWEADLSNSDFAFDMNTGTMVVLTADENCPGTGVLLEMHFFVDKNVELGDYTISFQLYQEECFNQADERVPVALPRVTVSVMDVLYGDANDDGKVSLQDALVLRRYLANRDPETNESTIYVGPGADANGDGNVGLQDALLLRQYLANRDLGTGESTVVLGPSVPENPVVYKQAEYNTTTSVMPSNWNEFTYVDNNDTQIMSYIGSSFFGYDYKFENDQKFNADGSINKDGIVPGAYTVNYSAATGLEDVTATVDAKWGYTDEQKAEGGYAWKITLRDDLRWDDGTPITAADFEYSMKELLNPDFMNFRANTYYDTLMVKGAYAYFNQNLEGTYEPLGSLGYGSVQEAIDAGETLYINIWNMWGTKGYIDAEGNECPEYVAIDDETIYSIDGSTNPNADPCSGKFLYEHYGLYLEPGTGYDACIYVENQNQDITWEEVGCYAIPEENAIVVCLDKRYELLKEDGSLSVWSAYYMSGLPLVKRDLYESCKIEPAAGATLWTSNYNSSLATTASWGPYKLTQFEAGSHYRLEKNPYWFGWNMEENKNQYNITAINCHRVNTASEKWLGFVSGIYDDAALGNAGNVVDYLDSKYVYFSSTSTGTFGMQLYSNLNVLKSSENNNGILAIQEFRHAFNLALDRHDLVKQMFPGSAVPCFGLLNDGYYYDIESSPDLADGGKYRNSTIAKEGILRAYGYTDNGDGTWTNGDLVGLSTEEAYETLTGYNPVVAKQKMQEAIDILLADPEAYGYDSTKNITLVYGASSDNEKQRFRAQYLQNVLDDLTVGTALEDKIDVVFDASAGSQWANAFRTGATQIGFGYGFSGNAFNPFDIIGAFVNPDDSLNYHMYWDTSAIDLTLTMPAGDYAGAGETITMSVQNWYYCMNGLAQSESQPVQYNWSEGMAPTEARLMILSKLEEITIQESRSVMIIADGGGSFLGAKFRYISKDEHTFMGFGGIRYMEVMYTDDEWAEFVAANNYDLSEEYKKTKEQDFNGDLSGTYDVTLWVSEQNGVADLTLQQIEAFEAANPGIVINASIETFFEGDVYANIITDVATAPDIYCFAQDTLARLVQAGALAPLSINATNTVKTNNDASSVAAASENGNLYAYPMTSDNGYFMYYDTSIISEEEAESLEAMIAACEKSGRKFRYALENAWFTASFFIGTGCHSNWIMNQEGAYVGVDDTYNSAAGMAAMKGMQKLAQSACYDSNADIFTDAAVVITGIWNAHAAAAHFGANLGATDLPSFEVDGKSYHLGSYTGNKLMGVKPQTDAKKQAVLHLLAQYLTNEECQMDRYNQFQWGPSNLNAQASEAVQSNISLAALLKQNNFGQPQGQIHGSWWDIAKLLGAEARYATSDADLQKALDNYDDAINYYLFGVDRETWSLIGSICGTMWDTDIPMTQIDDITWESDPLELHAGEEFKVRQGYSWDMNFGFEFNGQNFVVETTGTYIVRFVWHGGEDGTVILIPVNTGVDFVSTPVADTAYKYAVQQNNLDQILFFTGEMSGNYLATSTNPADGVNVFVENVDGGQRIFFISAEGVKTYIDVVPRGVDQPGRVNIVLTETPSCVYTWDAERKTFVTNTVADNTWYLGCYNTYNTISASNTSYIENVEVIGDTQFPAGLCVVEGYMQE